MKGHVPLRTCLGCGQVRPKQELLRIACNREGQIAIDPEARLPGRGAYVCRRPECGQLLQKKKALSRCWRRAVSGQNKVYQEVLEYLHAHNR